MKRKPLYGQIFDDLQQKILNGEYAPNEQLPTEAELAAMYGVSQITSKRALMELERAGLIYRKRGSGSFVKARLETAAVSFQDGRVARNDKIVAIVLPLKEYDSTGLLEYIRGATELLSRHGYYLSVHTTSRAGSDELNVLRNLVKQGISGIIYYPIRSDMNMTELFALAMNGYPLVTIDKYFDGFPIKYAASDNIDGGYKAVSHLIENGHKRIAFVAYNGFETATTIKNRYFGYCKALQENGLPIESHLTITKLTGLYADPKDRYHRLIVDLMNKGVTAVLAENDLIAIDLLKACIDLGIQVPRQLSIVGFDNTELSAHLDVPLTSVAQDFYNIGRAAASLLMEGLEQGTISSGPCLLPVRLVVRQSTSALRSAHL